MILNLRKFPVMLGIVASIFLLTLFSCEGDKDSAVINIELRNASGEEIHMWIEGESIDPSNKLSPGASRITDIEVENNKGDTPVPFMAYAGKGGQTLTSEQFEATALNVTIVYSGGSLVME